jgi:hypothetical protein
MLKCGSLLAECQNGNQGLYKETEAILTIPNRMFIHFHGNNKLDPTHREVLPVTSSEMGSENTREKAITNLMSLSSRKMVCLKDDVSQTQSIFVS